MEDDYVKGLAKKVHLHKGLIVSHVIHLGY
jgi:hypothetical protein